MTSRNFRRCSGSIGLFHQGFDVAADGCQRGAQLMRDIGHEIASHPIDPAQVADVVQHEHRPASLGARRSGLGAEDARTAGAAHRVERHLYRRAPFAFERSAELTHDAGLPHGLDIVAAEQVALEIQHPPSRVVREPQPSFAVDDEHPFDHARQNGFHSRAIGLELVQPAGQMRRLGAPSRLELAHAPVGNRRADPESSQPGRHGHEQIKEGVEHAYGSASL